MKGKNFIKSTSLYMLAIIIPQIMGFVMLPIITRYLTPEEYGIYTYTSSIIGFFFVISALGLHAYYLREYYESSDKENLGGTIYLFLIIFNTLFIGICLLLGEKVFIHLGINIPFNPYMKLAFIGLYFSVFEIIPIRVFRIKKESQKYFCSVIFRTGLIYFLNIYFVIFLKKGLTGKYYADIIGYALFSIYYILYMIKNTNIASINIKFIKEGLKFSKYIIPADILQMLVNRGDRVIIEKFLSFDKLGEYSIASTISSVSSTISTATYQALEPDLFKKANSDEFINEIKKVKNVFMLLVFSVTMGIGVFAEEILIVLTDESYWGTAINIKILVLVSPLLAFNQIIYMINLVEKKTFVKLVSYGVGGAVIIIINLILLPHVGIIGAGISKIISSCFIIITGLYFTTMFKLSDLEVKKDIGAYMISIMIIFMPINQYNFLFNIFLKTILIMLAMLSIIKIYGFNISKFLFKMKREIFK